MAHDELAKEVAARFKAGAVRTPEDLLKAIEDVQSLLHTTINRAIMPDDATREEQVALSRIERVVKAMYDQTENIRLDLDGWIFDYKARHRP